MAKRENDYLSISDLMKTVIKENNLTMYASDECKGSMGKIDG